ncbi:biotin--[acetyl-CoA-carboxylase] ligase [Desulfurococcus amylolyticus]|nr:biotin--[acetyl-CoA-carboxylase] ligase [Desulfurococcus amylolyticus]
MSSELALKLELVRILSEHDEIPISEVVREIGVQQDELISMINELSRYYLMETARSRVSWSPGDNPRRLKPWGWNYLYRIITGSTMTSAKQMPPWSIVVSEMQTQGRGRHGKTWIGNLGGLWITFKINTTPQVTQVLSIAIPVLLVRMLRDKLGINVEIKWPNDIIFGDKKIAGILLEGEYKESVMVTYIGIGINVNNDPPLEVAESIKNIVGHLIPRNRILSYLSGWIGRLDRLAGRPDELRMEYMEHLSTLGRKVIAMTSSGEIQGIAKDVTEYGELIIENESGSHRLSSGEILRLRHAE